jgi:hydrogenase expression/formation protein HypE
MKQNSEKIILLSHGGGGWRTRHLIREAIVKHLGNPLLNKLDDGVYLSLNKKDIVFTTDSFVVKPLFFPGGDIGKLAVCGTVNDLAMMAAAPKYLSMGLIIEEGFPLADLERIIRSVKKMLVKTGAQLVTGDTKVVEKGMGFGLFINTAGVGIRPAQADTSVANARPGDMVIITGSLGDHGAAVLSCREGMQFKSKLSSDVAPLWGLVAPLIKRDIGLHCLRDPTRGGLASALCDIAESSRVGIRIFEKDIPVKKEVRGVCRLLGLDPLHMACEGRAVVVCRGESADAVLKSLKSDALGRGAGIIGMVTGRAEGMVILETESGGERIIEMPMGEDTPRIC